MSRPTRVLVVDDSTVIRGLLTRYIDAEPDLEVAATASDGRAGVKKVRELQPDVVVLDIEMPVMTGLEALAAIRELDARVPIIMFSTLTAQGASVTIDALAKGATDYATKPSGEGNPVKAMQHVQRELITKIRSLGPRATATADAAPVSTPPPTRTRTASVDRVDAVVIGSSTGGPNALEIVFGSIPAPLPLPMLVVQHMPPAFTAALADRLGRKTGHRVEEAVDGRILEPGTVAIAPGGRHLRLRRVGRRPATELYDGELVNSCRPSVEPLFDSAADVFGNRLLAVMLTGMGRDGAVGARRIADLGAHVLAQDEATSVVWGMPGAVVGAGAATEVLPLERIGPRVTELVVGSSLHTAGASP